MYIPYSIKQLFHLLLFSFFIFISCKKENVLSKKSDVFYIRNGGADMPVHIYGNITSQHVVILLHGGPGDNGLSYRSGAYYSILEEKLAMAYWDQRGQGMAHGNYPNSELTIANMVDDLAVLIKTIRFRYGESTKVYLMGHSWGGTLGTAFLVTGDLQNNVDGWIEVAGAHDLLTLNKAALKKYILIGEQEIQKGNNVDKWKEIVSFSKSVDTNNINLDASSKINEFSFVAEDLLPQIKPDDSGGMSWFFSPINPLNSYLSGLHTNTQLENETETADYSDQLNKITIPCLFLWGQYDFNVPFELGIQAFEEVSSTKKELFIFQASGHSPMNNEPDLFCEKVLGFLGL